MKLSALMMILILSTVSTSFAQIDLGKIRDKVKKSKGDKPNEKANPKRSSSTTPTSKPSSELGADAVILDETLLNRRFVNFGYENGRLRLMNIRAMNLPRSIDKTHDKFFVTYRDASGKRLAAFRAYAQAPVTKRSWLLGNFLGVDDASNDFTFSKDGDYYLEFSVGKNPFDRFNFSVKKHINPEGKTTYLINGGWQDLAYLKYDPKIRRPTLIFNVFLRDLNEGTGPRGSIIGTYKAQIVRAADRKVIGIDKRKGRTIGLHRYWDSPLITFMHATKPEQLKAETLLNKDGKYYVELTYSGKPYGKYHFEVRNGQFVGVGKYKGEKIGTDGTVTWMLRKQ